MANIFALRDLSLNAFLFSDVGVEANGTSLTILSSVGSSGERSLGRGGGLGPQAEGCRDPGADRQHLANASKPAGVR